jgi:hypothetical protein
MTEATDEQRKLWAEAEARRTEHFREVHTRMTDKVRGRDMNMTMQGPLSMTIKTRVDGLKQRSIGTLFGKTATVPLEVTELNQWIRAIEQLEKRNQQLENADRNRVRTPAEIKLNLIQQLMTKALAFTAKNKAILRFVPLDDLAHVMEHGQLPVDSHNHYTL